MYYISSKVGQTYGVTDTADGIEEFYTIQQLVELTLRGFRIGGCHYRTREDLKTRGFYAIEVQQKKKVLEIKVGKFYKIRYKGVYNSNEQNSMGYCSGIETTEYDDYINFILLNGKELKVSNSNIAEFKIVKNINPSFVSLVNERLKLSDLIAKKKAQLEALDKEIYQLKTQLSDMESKFLSVNGLITMDRFCSIVLNNMSNNVKNTLSSLGFQVTTPCNVGLSRNSIYFTRCEYVANGLDCDFVYREYDNNLFMRDDAENSNKYKSYIKSYRKTAPINLPFNDNLVLADYKVLYQGWYEIKVGDEPLTEALALSIAESIKLGVKPCIT